MSFIFNPDKTEFAPTAEEEHRHSGERNEYSLGRGKAGRRMGEQTLRQRVPECRGWGGLGRMHPSFGKEGIHRVGKQRTCIAMKGKIPSKIPNRRRGRTTRWLAKFA